MIDLHLTRGDNREGVYLRLPATPAEVGEAYAMLDNISRYARDTRIAEASSPVANIGRYIIAMSSDETLYKLNTLAEKIGKMDARQRNILSGALDAKSINGLNDVLKLTEHLNDYVILSNVGSDIELGRFLVETGYKDFPDAVRPYLDYTAIGAEYYAENGGAYGPGGYSQSALRRLGADDELIDTIDGYMVGEDSMVEDGVRQSEFGLIRRCSTPFPDETQTMQIRGM